MKKAYIEKYKAFGDSALGVHWEGEHHQARRFQQLYKLMEKDNSRFSILDAGCGLGHFHQFLAYKKLNFDYFGIDVLPEFVDKCVAKGLNTSRGFVEKIKGKFDYIVCSGAFNLGAELYMGVESMWKASKKGIAFNFCDKGMYPRAGKKITHHEPEEVFGVCRLVGDNKCQITMSQGYLAQDVTVIIKRWKYAD